MLKDKIRKFLTGVTISKEYPCVDHLEFKDEVKAWLSVNGKQTDITADHIFLGYKPLIAGIFLPGDIDAGEVSITFIHQTGTKLADIRLKKVTARKLGGDWFILFAGLHANVYFLPVFNRIANSVLRKFRKRIPGNVEMNGNEYLQVQAMYSVPRKISIISLGIDGLYNMFPTDLHGNAGREFYVDSLRKAGKACEQVLQLRRVVKADVDLSVMNDAFAMGKNHMKELQELSDLPAEGYSSLYRLPLPKGVVAYKELEVFDDIEIVIHRLLIFTIKNEAVIHTNRPVLACTNGHYIQWRLDHSLPDNLYR
jgi:hypothetical protein